MALFMTGILSLVVEDGVVQGRRWGGRDCGGCTTEGPSGDQNRGQVLEQADIHSKVSTEYQLCPQTLNGKVTSSSDLPSLFSQKDTHTLSSFTTVYISSVKLTVWISLHPILFYYWLWLSCANLVQAVAKPVKAAIECSPPFQMVTFGCHGSGTPTAGKQMLP